MGGGELSVKRSASLSNCKSVASRSPLLLVGFVFGIVCGVLIASFSLCFFFLFSRVLGDSASVLGVFLFFLPTVCASFHSLFRLCLAVVQSDFMFSLPGCLV